MSEHESEQDQEIYATLVEIKQEPIELYKILKIESLVSGGGEAKQVIAEGYVLLNGEVETRKRKKVYAGDLVSFNGEHLQIALKGQLQEFEFVERDEKINLPETTNQANNLKPQKNAKEPKKARKPIQF
jgi:ribosome-associated protein